MSVSFFVCSIYIKNVGEVGRQPLKFLKAHVWSLEELVLKERKGLLLFTKVPNFIECNPQPSWKLVVGRPKLDGASTQGLLGS